MNERASQGKSRNIQGSSYLIQKTSSNFRRKCLNLRYRLLVFGLKNCPFCQGSRSSQRPTNSWRRPRWISQKITSFTEWRSFRWLCGATASKIPNNTCVTKRLVLLSDSFSKNSANARHWSSSESTRLWSTRRKFTWSQSHRNWEIFCWPFSENTKVCRPRPRLTATCWWFISTSPICCSRDSVIAFTFLCRRWSL